LPVTAAGCCCERKNLVRHEGSLLSAMSSLLLKDKVIFLTGGSTGIGWDCGKAYAAEGAKVAIVACDKEPVAKAAAQLGADHLGLVCDVSRGDDVKAEIEKTLARYGKFEAVHNN